MDTIPNELIALQSFKTLKEAISGYVEFYNGPFRSFLH